MPVKQPQTPEQITKFGHIAIALRKYLTKHSMKKVDLARAIDGFSSAQVYNVVNGKHAPGPKLREKLSKATGIPESELMANETTAVAVIPKGPVGKMLDQLQRTDVLSFTVNGNGEARIKLDVTLPIETAKPLFRLLLDTGVGT
jgi:hypothetical protein